MGRDKGIEIEDKMAWTKKSTVNAIAHPITQGMAAAALSGVRVKELIVHDLSTNAQFAIGYQLADDDDELSWGSATVLSAAWAIAAGTTYESSFTDLSSLTKRRIRFVILAKNTSGTGVEIGRVGCKLDLREA